jgi:hypothetical protein
MFKVFRSAAPIAWTGKDNWFFDKCDLPWDVFLPYLASYNKKCYDLIKTRALILDENMPG